MQVVRGLEHSPWCRMQKLKKVQSGRGRERLSWRRWGPHRQQKKSEGGSCSGDLNDETGKQLHIYMYVSKIYIREM